MVRRILAAVTLAAAPAVAQAQSVSAPLVVTATVVSTCAVEVPRAAERAVFPAFPVKVTCVRRGAAARIEPPATLRRAESGDAVLTINF